MPYLLHGFELIENDHLRHHEALLQVENQNLQTYRTRASVVMVRVRVEWGGLVCLQYYAQFLETLTLTLMFFPVGHNKIIVALGATSMCDMDTRYKTSQVTSLPSSTLYVCVTRR